MYPTIDQVFKSAEEIGEDIKDDISVLITSKHAAYGALSTLLYHDEGTPCRKWFDHTRMKVNQAVTDKMSV